MRENFSPTVKKHLSQSVALRCSNPSCNKLTAGPNENNGSINIGEAAHICAASPSGPRYDPEMSTEERKSFSNGIWLCKICARIIDLDEKIYTKELLLEWKKAAEQRAEDSFNKIYNTNNIFKEKEKKILKEISKTFGSYNTRYMLKSHHYAEAYERKSLDDLYTLMDFLDDNIHKIKNKDLLDTINIFKKLIFSFRWHLTTKGGPSRDKGYNVVDIEENQEEANELSEKIWDFYIEKMEVFIDE
ncbi:hypothetical protein OCF14_08880 [Bacillus cereus]|nr:hypothetical protein [Bacillus cereus]MCU5143234.1 hypothetical protein [Bacillus cereus]